MDQRRARAAAVRRGRSLVGHVAQRVVPHAELLRLRTLGVGPLPPATLALVYRARNAATVARLLGQADLPLVPALWALDEVAPELAEHTVGQGPGPRFALLEGAAAAASAPDGSWLFLADDDVHLRRGSLADLLRTAVLLGLDVSQPSHAKGSTHFWGVNRHRPLVLARRTRFVETGPLLLMSPAARAACLPVPATFAMGIGSEAVWGSRPELRTGVVDAVTMIHTGRIGAAYDAPAEWARTEPEVRRLLAPLGLSSVQELQVVDGTWRMWQPVPRWPTR